MPKINIDVPNDFQIKIDQGNNEINLSLVPVPVPVVKPVEPNKEPVIIQPITPPKAGKFNYVEVLSLTLYGQTWQVSGKKPSWSKNPHRGDCFMDDGMKDAKRDLSGGFHDAGDCIKVVLASFSNCSQFVFGALYNKEALKATQQYNATIDIIRHYCDWGIKCHEMSGDKTIRLWHWVSDNAIDHKTMLAPEQQEKNYYQPKGLNRKAFAIGDGYEPVGEEPPSIMAACFALTSILLKDESPDYSADLLRRAKSLFAFAQERRGKYTPHSVYGSSSLGDEITFAAIALHLATNDKNYLSQAEQYFDTHIKFPGWTWIVDNQSSVSTFLLASVTKNPKYLDMCKRWVDSWIKGVNGVRKHASPLRSNSDWGSIPQFSSALALAMFGNKYLGLNVLDVEKVAKQGIDYVLGDNQKGFSWLAGYGSNYPQNLHHRSLMNNKSLVGTGLWAAGEKADGFYQDKDDDWITNEAGCYQSAVFMLLSFII